MASVTEPEEWGAREEPRRVPVDLWARQDEANWPVWAASVVLVAGALMIWEPSAFSATIQLFATAAVLAAANLFGREAKRRCRQGAPHRVLAAVVEGLSFVLWAIWFSWALTFLLQDVVVRP